MIPAHTASSPARELVVVLNCGSSSIKFAVFDGAQRPLPRKPLWNGKVQGIGGPAPDFGESGVPPFAITLDTAHPYRAALQLIRERITARLAQLDGARVAAIAHRVVHGGSRYFEPVRVDAGVLADLKAFIPLAPLHQPFALEAMDILLRERPELVQVACFDTAFHHTLPKVEQLLPLPHAAWERGLRRYGFHGLSYEYMATALPERHGDLARGRTLVAHLGSGASLCAMQGLQSVATTMGFSALDGLPMGTRCGQLDPGVLLYLMDQGLGARDITRILYKESGLKGLSGISHDMRTLLDSDDPHAREAVDYYVFRIRRELGAMAAVLGGLDGVVFTGGIGENAAPIRARVIEGLEFLGLSLDQEANAGHGPRIGTGPAEILVIPTDEERVIARAVARALAGDRKI